MTKTIIIIVLYFIFFKLSIKNYNPIFPFSTVARAAAAATINDNDGQQKEQN
jgi:hypothetical protein